MTEPPQATPAQPASAGALLRAARERAGVHIGFLAATLKVPVRKLELLEESRFEELPDATFVRALSLSVCRVLKCDPAPVLAALPRQEHVASTLEQVSHGMNTPFARRGRPEVVIRTSSRRLGWVLTAAILGLAAAAWLIPADWQARLPGGAASQGGSVSGPSTSSSSDPASRPAPLPATSAAAVGSFGAASQPLVQTVHGALQAAGPGASGPMASAITVTEASWVEASDVQGRQVWARTLTPGEAVELESSNGLRLTIGNAAGTQVRWRGRVIDLTSATRDNVARIELK